MAKGGSEPPRRLPPGPSPGRALVGPPPSTALPANARSGSRSNGGAVRSGRKAGTWYMLAGVDGKPRVYRVSRIEDAELTDETFERPTGFDLRSTWAAQGARFKGSAPGRVSARVRVDPEVSGQFARVVGDQIVDRSADGVVVLDFPACEAAASVLTAFGAAIGGGPPRPLRCSPAGQSRRCRSSVASWPITMYP
jgi:WYL domain